MWEVLKTNNKRRGNKCSYWLYQVSTAQKQSPALRKFFYAFMGDLEDAKEEFPFKIPEDQVKDVLKSERKSHTSLVKEGLIDLPVVLQTKHSGKRVACVEGVACNALLDAFEALCH